MNKPRVKWLVRVGFKAFLGSGGVLLPRHKPHYVGFDHNEPEFSGLGLRPGIGLLTRQLHPPLPAQAVLPLDQPGVFTRPCTSPPRPTSRLRRSRAKLGTFLRRKGFHKPRCLYTVRGAWRHVRTSPWLTRRLGPQYRRSRVSLEVDITYLCNLACCNCNRSARQAPEHLHMPVEKFRGWVNEWIARGKCWKRVRVLGGEPTLHPQFEEIIAELVRYRSWSPGTIIQVASNGFGARVQARLAALPAGIFVKNSQKQSSVQTTFGPFNLAPKDDAVYEHCDFTNACSISAEAGMGLTPLGYYPCAVAGGIDRVLGAGLGYPNLPAEEDDMLPLLSKSCSLCGHFRDGHCIPPRLRAALLEEKISPSWRKLYAEWRERKRAQYGNFPALPLAPHSADSMASPPAR